MTLDARRPQGVVEIGRELRPQRAEPLFLQFRTPLAVLGLVPWRGLARGAETFVLDRLRRQGILDHEFPPFEQSQAIGVRQYFNVSPSNSRHPVVVALERHVTVLIGRPFMRLVGRWKLGWQFPQLRTLQLEGLDRNQAGLGGRPMVVADRGPFQRLLVQVLQTAENAALQEVRLHGPETPFLSRLAIGVPQLVADEFKTIPTGEDGHFRHDYRVSARATQPRQIRVVDHAPPRRVTPEQQGFVQEALHHEAVEAVIEP